MRIQNNAFKNLSRARFILLLEEIIEKLLKSK